MPDGFTEKDEETVQSRLESIAEALKRRHPKKNFSEIRSFIEEQLSTTV